MLAMQVKEKYDETTFTKAIAECRKALNGAMNGNGERVKFRDAANFLTKSDDPERKWAGELISKALDDPNRLQLFWDLIVECERFQPKESVMPIHRTLTSFHETFDPIVGKWLMGKIDFAQAKVEIFVAARTRDWEPSRNGKPRWEPDNDKGPYSETFVGEAISQIKSAV